MLELPGLTVSEMAADGRPWSLLPPQLELALLASEMTWGSQQALKYTVLKCKASGILEALYLKHRIRHILLL